MALVLGRKINEAIIIHVRGVEIIVRPVQASSGRVRLAFEAPPEVSIRREEVPAERQAVKA